jgi:hypothetical protein
VDVENIPASPFSPFLGQSGNAAPAECFFEHPSQQATREMHQDLDAEYIKQVTGHRPSQSLSTSSSTPFFSFSEPRAFVLRHLDEVNSFSNLQNLSSLTMPSTFALSLLALASLTVRVAAQQSTYPATPLASKRFAYPTGIVRAIFSAPF